MYLHVAGASVLGGQFPHSPGSVWQPFHELQWATLGNRHDENMLRGSDIRTAFLWDTLHFSIQPYWRIFFKKEAQWKNSPNPEIAQTSDILILEFLNIQLNLIQLNFQLVCVEFALVIDLV